MGSHRQCPCSCPLYTSFSSICFYGEGQNKPVHLNHIYIVIDNTTVTNGTQSCPVVYFHVSCYLYLYYICETTPLPIPLHDTRQGSLNVYRPRLRPLKDTTLPLMSSPDHHRNTLCTCCLPCSCPCPAPRVYPLPARTSRRLRGGRRLAVTVTSLAGGRRGP